ncbi:hypothetical protein Dsin_006274 [Dipteronia sinensis]|uniref:Uncharacterized protein n=1 Tax=Dipteronia sinensis TaxID=43782 RepID=A0AAE0AYE4_9ROSI|nr:hypothetical protein Dsin_006274 [Dipteronia sinensis]
MGEWQNTTNKLTLLRFVASNDTSIEYGNSSSTAEINYLSEKELDEITVEFMREWHETVEYNKKVTSNRGGIARLRIQQRREYELIEVGKGRFPSTMEAKFAEYRAENVELGAIGNILASSDHHCVIPSVIVIQQHNSADSDSNETAVSKMVTVNDATNAEESCV